MRSAPKTEARPPEQQRASASGDGASPEQTLTVTDNRTGSTYELAITDGTVRALDLRQIKTDEDDFGLQSDDPAFMNTDPIRRASPYLDGDAGHQQDPGV